MQVCGTSQTRESPVEGHPKCCALLSQTGVDHIFEIINRVLLGFELVGVEGHGDIVERLVNEQANVQFESDGGELEPGIQKVDGRLGNTKSRG